LNWKKPWWWAVIWISISTELPDQLECDHCVLQWRYHTGNSWGTDENGNSGIGLGNQEEFYGCADIEIISTSSSPQFSTTTNIISSTTSSVAKTTTIATSPQQTSTTKSTSTTTSKGTNSPTPNPEGPFCSDKNDGLYSHDKDCTLFYKCFQGNTYVMNCPAGLHFNQNQQYCDWPANVNCSL